MLVTAALIPVVTVPTRAAATGGPSYSPADLPSVPATQQGVGPGTTGDEVGPNALHGNQSGGTSLPGTGNYTTTAPQRSASWNVTAQTGDFSWNYPLRLPPAPGGQQPELALSYNSSAVDGLTSTTNNQASWIGDGWSLWPGYVERSYGSCPDDIDGTDPDEPRDQCWRTDNATLSFSGGGGPLVMDADQRWRTRADDGSRIERLGNPDGGYADDESWKVTTTDGTQYFFGSRPASKSVWTVPVFGDDALEPCHGSTFATSSCTQPYRWNLDKVVDRFGNAMLYEYETEKNFYGINNNSSAAEYVRGGWLKSVDYGLREGDPAVQATARVGFTVADRCVDGSTCAFTSPNNYPDVPLNLKCDGTTCPDRLSPTFWTAKKLTKITAEVRTPGTSTFDPVDSWTLRHELPDAGDNEKPALWLRGITHTGHLAAAADTTLPETVFDGVRLPNRVQSGDGFAALARFRMNAITSESGGTTSIAYHPPDCTPTSLPANPETNTLRCFPVKWSPPGSPLRTDHFHKYVVSQVSQYDRVAGSLATESSYEYHEGAAWHYDESELTKPEDKTWNVFRGYGRVVLRQGSGQDGPRTRIEQRYYRGMHGDKLPTGTKVVNVTDSEGGSAPDENWLSGRLRETVTHDGDTGPAVSKSISEPTWQGPTATRGDLKSYIVREGAVRQLTALTAGGWRTTRKQYTYDDRGLVTTIDDQGDTTTAADDRCSRTTYARNTAAWLLSFAVREEVVAKSCAATPVFPADAVSDTLTHYDNQAEGVAPTRGAATRVEVLSERPAGGPVRALATTVVYDTTGRRLEVADALGNTTKTAFTPAVGGPVTQTTATDAKGFTTTSLLEPGTGQPRKVTDPNNRVTESEFDSLGRLTAVWLANRNRAATPSESPNASFTYLTRNDGPNAVTSSWLGPNGVHTSSTDLYDGLLRKRQSQSPAPGGTGRLLSDYQYDSHGRAYKGSMPYYNDGAVDNNIWLAADGQVPGQVRREYDGAGRQIAEIFSGHNVEKWRTTTAYTGDTVSTTPPEGGTATTAVQDARGRMVEQRQHTASATPTGPYQSTTYTYDASDQITQVKDPQNNTWSYTYDLRGRVVSSTTPDQGTTTSTYDEASRPVTTTDSRGQTLATTYDVLGRRTALHKDSPTGAKLAEWTYDTVTRGKGQPASATRYVGANAYTAKVFSYNARYQPLRTDVVIPAAEGALAGTYTDLATYNVDGSVAAVQYPAVANLAQEMFSTSYTDDGRAKRSWGGSGGTTEYVADTEFTRYGEVQHLQLGQGGKRAWLTYVYEDNTRRLSRTIVDAEVPQPMVADLNYTYDDVGNILSIADTPVGKPADVQCFTYDRLRRMTEAWTPSGTCAAAPSTAGLSGPAPYWNSYAYDEVGNRTAEVEHATAGDTTRTYAYEPTGHGLASVTTVKPGGTTALDQYSYDAAGNAVTRNLASAGQVLEWDAEGNLAKVTEGTKITSFLYDADGNRLIRREPGAVTLYLGSQEVRLDTTTGTKTATRYYSHGGQVVAMRQGGGVTWLASDHQGTNQIAINATTLSVTQRRQKPFGETRGAPVTFPGEKGFVGGTQDSSINLVSLGARHYDPTLGRFISVDPFFDAGDPQEMHGYTYAKNNPTTYSDPSGMRADGCGWWCSIWQVVQQVIQQVIQILEDHINNQSNARDERRRQAAEERQTEDEAIKRSGMTREDYEKKKQLATSNKSWMDVALESAPEILGDLIGYNDVRDCFGDVDILACASLIPWGKILKAAEILDKIRSVWKRADNVMASIDAAREDMRRVNNLKDEIRASKPPGCKNSFTPDTPVLLADGSREPLGDIRVGDEVLATDPVSGRTAAGTVVATIVGTGVKDLIDITVTTGGADSTLTATDDHPFWLPERQDWLPAAALRTGDWLLTPTGDRVRITGLTPRTTSTTVHNLSVEGIHTYYAFAGEAPVLVHNCGGWSSRTERAGDLADKYTPGQSTRDPASQWYHEYLSNDELLASINDAGKGDGIVVSRGGVILGGHHRWDEIRARIMDGRLPSDTQIRIDVYDGE
ncbi:hypothetical protein UO65_1708 [Actinokineospora spheciospongiae]|uniref:Hint domain-containing protein n=1 Tax=Actinokineospora spheciospongiae TaxID=909613 RepID=W7IRJ5_9PSEU|nr:RHS repeat-associated core domain-containing protein [Actinokineospora spheciospongiae]EWC62998.1 hypothetical protein UO65_1708 [Actinokineospora spheciospongiae]